MPQEVVPQIPASEIVRLRVSPEIKEQWLAEARRADQTLSEFLRQKLGVEHDGAQRPGAPPRRADNAVDEVILTSLDNSNAALDRRINQLHNQGYTKPVAERMAKAETEEM